MNPLLSPGSGSLLPADGWALYNPFFWQKLPDLDWLSELGRSLNWQAEQVRMFGQLRILKRQVAWYGGRAFSYTYSGVERVALPFTPELEAIRLLLQRETGSRFNSVLANRYFSGSDAMGWHRDNEPTLVAGATIASVSFGTARDFCFRHMHTGEKRKLRLEPGSLLLMGGVCQQFWQHALLRSARSGGERINLTFRLMREDYFG
jgi:alkylated DNA repair dioxygenase AlkB